MPLCCCFLKQLDGFFLILGYDYTLVIVCGAAVCAMVTVAKNVNAKMTNSFFIIVSVFLINLYDMDGINC